MFTEQHTLFLHATPEERADAMDRLQHFSADYGDTIVQEGEEIRAIAYVLDGTISMLVTDYELAEVTANMTVGASAIWGEGVSLTALRAIRPVEFLVVDRDDYAALRAQGNVVAYNLERIALETLTSRVRDMEERLAAILGASGVSPPENDQPGLLQQLVSFVRKPKQQRAAPNIDVPAVLANSALFADIAETSLAEFARVFRPVGFPSGWWIYALRDLPDAAYLVTQGKVEVVMGSGELPIESKNKDVTVGPLATAEPGSMFGVTSLVDEHPRTVSARAVSDVQAVSIDMAAFRRLYRQDDAVGSDFRNVLLRAMLSTQELVAAYLYQVHLDNLRYAQQTVSFLYRE